MGAGGWHPEGEGRSWQRWLKKQKKVAV